MVRVRVRLRMNIRGRMELAGRVGVQCGVNADVR